MAADVETHARSGRYIKVYLIVWGLLAAGGLSYLATLALQPETAATAALSQAPEPDQSLLLANRALSEVGKVRQSVGEMQRDLGQMRDHLEQRDSSEKTVQSRLAALEDRVTTLATPVVAPPTPSAPQGPSAKKDKAKSKNLVEVPAVKGPSQRAPSRVISVVGVPASVPGGQDPAATPTAEPAPPAAPLETGSLAPPATITFGEPVVTPSRTATFFAVQIGAGQSLDALRLSWSLLVEKHGETLAALEPRAVAPRTEGGPYRLVAGPLTSKAEAERVCAQMGVSRANCFSTSYVGDPL